MAGAQVGDTSGPERPPEARSLEEVLGADGGSTDAAPPYSAQAAAAFVEGRVTLADLEGVTKPEQYKIAEVGHGYLSTGKLNEAKKIFEGLLALDPYDAYFNAAVGSVAHQQDRWDEAEKFYSRSIELNGYFASAFANRGELRVVRGDLLAGLQDLQRALELDPEAQEPATLRARVTLQALQEKLNKEAEAGLSPAVEDSPKTSPVAPRPKVRVAKPRTKKP